MEDFCRLAMQRYKKLKNAPILMPDIEYAHIMGNVKWLATAKYAKAIPRISLITPEIISEIAICDSFIIPERYPLAAPEAHIKNIDGATAYIAGSEVSVPAITDIFGANRIKMKKRIIPNTEKVLKQSLNNEYEENIFSASFFDVKIEIALGIPALPRI